MTTYQGYTESEEKVNTRLARRQALHNQRTMTNRELIQEISSKIDRAIQTLDSATKKMEAIQ